MGGRQAHGRPLLQKAGGRKKNNNAPRPKNGRVDVLALAAKQVGESKTKGIRRRDLDIERDPSKRRRGQDEEDAEEDAGGLSKRRRRNAEDGEAEGEPADNSDDEMQSDSDGNEWHIGVGSDDDDSEIDSDEAFGESDDEMFDGYTFRGSSSAAPKKKAKRGKDDFEGFDEEEEDVGDDGEALGEEAIDLAQALDQVSSDEEPKKRGKADSEDSEESEGDSEDSEDSEEESEEGSEDSEDDSDMSGSASSESDDDLDALTSIATAFAGKSKAGETTAETTAALSKVSLADLGLTSSRDPQIKKSVKMLAKEEKADTADKAAGKSKKLDVPLSRMQQDELLRVAAADKAHETLDRWVDTVKQNRRAEHVSFSVAGSLAGTGLDAMELRPITQKTAQTDLEKTILSIMEESGLGPSAAEPKKTTEKEDGEKKTLSPEELKQLVNQRRRERELQSREVARAKRIKKIKSKAYRRVHRREKARNEAALAELEDGEDVDSEEEREAQHRQRAMERMGSRHRESKWAKRAKNTSRAAWDDDFRAGLVDMARRDEELRRKVEGRGSGDDDDNDDDDDDDDEDEEAFRARMVRQLQHAGPETDDAPRSALMNISFMKKAEVARKKANDEAVAEIMRDLDGAGSSDEEAEVDKGADDGNWTVVGRRTYGVAGQTNKTAKASRQAAVDKSGAPDETADAEEPATKTTTTTAAWGAASGLFHEDTAKTVQGAAGSWAKTRAKGKRKEVKVDNLQVEEALAQLSKKTEKKKEVLDDDTSSSGSSDEDEDRQDSGQGRRAGRLQLHDTNLLIKALGDDDAAAEFAREKAQLAADEAEAAEAEESRGRRGNGAGVDGEFLPGWGSWAGEGLRKKTPKAPVDKQSGRREKKKAARQDTKLARVMISERRVHKTGKYLASQLPHEFETKNQYERSLRLPVGPEWGTKMAFQEATKPRVLVKQGVVLPMARPTV